MTWYHVYAGKTGDAGKPPYAPAVWVNITVRSSDGCTSNLMTIGEFIDVRARGPLSITSVQDPLVHLRAADEQRIDFSLATDRFSPAP